MAKTKRKSSRKRLLRKGSKKRYSKRTSRRDSKKILRKRSVKRSAKRGSHKRKTATYQPLTPPDSPSYSSPTPYSPIRIATIPTALTSPATFAAVNAQLKPATFFIPSNVSTEEPPIVAVPPPQATYTPSSISDDDDIRPSPKIKQRAMSISFGAPVETIGMKMDSLFSELLSKSTMNYIATLASNVQRAHPIASIRLYKIAIQRCIRFYTGEGYREMNRYLLARPSKFAGPTYQTGGKQYRKHTFEPMPYIPVPEAAIPVICVRVLNFITSTCRLKSPLVVYRGLRDMRARDISEMTQEMAEESLTMTPRPGATPIPFVGQQMQIGAVFSNPAFMSTSLDRDVSENFRSSWGSSSTDDAAQKCCLFSITLPAGYPCLYLEPFSVIKAEHELLISPCCQFVVTAADRAEQVYKLKPFGEPTDGYTEYLQHLNAITEDKVTEDDLYAEVAKDLIMLNTLFDAVWSVRTSANRYEDVAQCICAKKCDIMTSQEGVFGRVVKNLKTAPEAFKALNKVMAVSKLHPYFTQQVTQEVRNLAFDFEDEVWSNEEMVEKAVLILEKLDYASGKLAEIVRTEHSMTVVIFFMELLERQWYFDSTSPKSESYQKLEECFQTVKDMLEGTDGKPSSGSLLGNLASKLFGK